MLPLCILTSFIPEERKDLGKLCCSMLNGSCGGTMEGLDENEENERKKREGGRRGGALCFLSLGSLLSFFFLFFFSHSPFISLSLNKVVSYPRQTPALFLEHILFTVTVFLDRSYLYNRLL